MRNFLPLLMLLALPACTPDPQAYLADAVPLHPDQFFNGTLDSYGVFENWRGQADSRFHMVATAAWDHDRGTMHEDFTYTDGSKAARDWTFRMTDAAHFIGTAPDVIGEAKGEVFGGALHWRYTILIPTGKPRAEQQAIDFDDWLYLVGDDRHMISRVHASKFGLPVGQLTMFFEKR